MKDRDNLPEKLFDLLAEKPFSGLSAQEKHYVNGFITQEEYESYGKVLNDFKEVDSEFTLPAPGLPSAKEGMGYFLLNFLNYRIPVYQVAAGFALFVIALWAFQNFNAPNTEENTGNNYANEESKAIGKPIAKDIYPEELVFNL